MDVERLVGNGLGANPDCTDVAQLTGQLESGPQRITLPNRSRESERSCTRLFGERHRVVRTGAVDQEDRVTAAQEGLDLTHDRRTQILSDLEPDEFGHDAGQVDRPAEGRRWGSRRKANESHNRTFPNNAARRKFRGSVGSRVANSPALRRRLLPRGSPLFAEEQPRLGHHPVMNPDLTFKTRAGQLRIAAAHLENEGVPRTRSPSETNPVEFEHGPGLLDDDPRRLNQSFHAKQLGEHPERPGLAVPGKIEAEETLSGVDGFHPADEAKGGEFLVPGLRAQDPSLVSGGNSDQCFDATS